jgi:UDP-N-acetylglucosamine diphosphorylase/glucosamine-1-phosphate N-acetyltransferase
MNRNLLNRPLAAVIMAAGKGKRMEDPARAKVMYEVLGKPMIHYVVVLARELGTERIIAVVGHQREAVIKYLNSFHPEVRTVVQAEQLGTGHAVMQAAPALDDFSGDVLILSGDVPLLRTDTMLRLIDHHYQTEASATILTADFPDPSGYGRILRGPEGSVERIVEHKDATEHERRLNEINSGIYIFERQKLFESLGSISPENVQNEYYLTDVFGYFSGKGWKISALKTPHAEEIMGVNTKLQLNEVHQILEERRKIRYTS